MPRILNPKDTSGTTRFIFDFNLTTTMVKQLFSEFKKDYPVIQTNSNAIKLIDKERKKAMEICNDYISFFPSLTEPETESIRKRIYKHIARRSEVYFSTAQENFELSIVSLLTDDLRTCASLLYYSLHKFINGKMYSHFNSKLHLEDHEINFREIEHFTSANFYLSTNKFNDLNVALSKDNYLSLLCHRTDCIDPFILSKYIIEKEKLDECRENIESYIEVICFNLFEKKYNDPDLLDLLNKEVTVFKQRKQKKHPTTQGEEVRASLAYAIQHSIEDTPNTSLWLFYALTLRLYWLRQTADYEFDFEVKTSIREMSILLSSIRSFLERQINTENKENFDGDFENTHDDKETIENNVFTNSKMHLERKTLTENNNLVFYNVDANFSSDINYTNKIYNFITAVHLDAEFNKEEIIMALNLTENITNKAKYFIYETTGALSISLYLHINDDGRWTAWIPYNQNKVSVLSHGELIKAFDEFLHHFIISYNEYHTTDYFPSLVASQPIFIEHNQELLNVDAVLNLENAIIRQRGHLEIKTAREIAYRLQLPTRYNQIKLENFILQINLIFDTTDPMKLVPLGDILLNELTDEPDEDNEIITLNFVVNDSNSDQTTNLFDTVQVFMYQLDKDHNFSISDNVDLYSVTPKELDNFILSSDNSIIMKNIVESINSKVYEKIMNGSFDNNTQKTINLCLSVQNAGSNPLATMGLWYLRNKELPLEESETLGIDYYKRAINFEFEDVDEEYIRNLNQKYHYELATFYSLRKEDYLLAMDNLDLGLAFGKNGYFYKDLLNLKDEIQVKCSMPTSSSNNESDIQTSDTSLLSESKPI